MPPLSSKKLLLRGACLALLLPLLATAQHPSGARVTLAELEQLLGWQRRTIKPDYIELSDGRNSLRLFPGQRRSEFNKTAIWLNATIEPANSEVVQLARDDVEQVILPLLQRPPARRRQQVRIMLDAGHGGEDGGAAASFPPLLEKELMLDLTLRIGRRLTAAGIVVGYTRTNDTARTLSERTTLAAIWQADAFVSLHANTAANREASGCETYILPLAGYPSTSSDSTTAARERKGNGHNVANLLLGYQIHRQLPGAKGRVDRGLRRARFQVLRDAPCPAALVEVGFLSNTHEARQLASRWHREQLARRIADGILSFAKYIEPPVQVYKSNQPATETLPKEAPIKQAPQ